MTITSASPTTLAVDGGTPVRPPTRRWPQWPTAAVGVERNLASVLESGRWAVSSPQNGCELFERRFARRFAEYVGTRHCVPVDHGASALVVALEALGLDYGETVLVPSLTWTASATAALRAGLVPVLVDVDRDTGCVRASDLDAGVDAAVVVVVHWSCAMADVPAISARAGGRGMTVIEDCAQAHGARWGGRSAGSLGRIGCFSMQNGKVLASGEGGAVVTDDDALAPLLEELRADSRRYRSDRGRRGELELVESASVMGANFAMNELNAAVLCAQIQALDAQHEVRNRNFALLSDLLADVPGVRVLRPPAQQDRLSIYEVPLVFDPLPGDMSAADVGDALTAELGRPFYPTDDPLHRSRLLRPWTKPALGPLARRFVELHRGRAYPNSEYLVDHVVVTHHGALLGDEQDVADVAEAVHKVVTAGDRRAR